MQRLFLCIAAVSLGCLAVPARLSADDAADHIKLGNALADKNDYGKAVQEYSEAIRLNPKLAKAYYSRGIAFVNLLQVDKAIADYTAAIRLEPAFADAFCNRSIDYRRKGEYDKAIADCTEAIRIDPKHAIAHCSRGFAYAGKGDYEKGTADLNRAVALAPKSAGLLVDFGFFLWMEAQAQDAANAKAEAAGDMEAAKAGRRKLKALKENAIAQWKLAVAVNPKAADAHSNLGYAYAEANDLESSERHLKEAVQLTPSSARPHNNLGRVMWRISEQREDEARAAEAHKEDKDKAGPAEAAKVARLKGEAKTKLDQAIVQFEEAARLDPYLLEARLNLGEVHLWRKDLDAAESQYKEILKLWSQGVKNPEVIDNFSQANLGMARVAIARKRPGEAVAFLHRSLDLNSKNAAAQELLRQLQSHEQGKPVRGDGGKK